jgi:mannose-6-phosphate isomerase
VRRPLTDTFLAACRYFATEKWEFTEPVAAVSSREHFDLIVILEDAGTLEWHDSRAEYAPAQLWMIPAALGAYEIAPSSRTTLLRTYVPHNSGEFVQRLKEAGVEESKWSRLVHR